MTSPVSDHDLINLLLAVGAERDITAADFDQTFEDLGLDSLARAEFAAKLQERTGVDAEEQTTADVTPNAIRQIVLAETSATAGR
ncbi:acyl carrier protein [Streptosporangium sp. NPDC051023]|uniref:acyl carrier protein n=1 Tax=Streptosporangium sp. NPDC051023 TaxID=3155410 RepID=UPI00344BCFBA